MQSKPIIKVYGERNSGTNYLEQLLATNFDIELLRYVPSRYIAPLLINSIAISAVKLITSKSYLGWKHGVPPIKHINSNKTIDLLIFTITKNPYTFLLSLHKRPYHYRGPNNLSFSEFIRRPWNTILRDGTNVKQLTNPIELWNKKNRSYLNLSKDVSQPVTNLKYESLIKDPQLILASISSQNSSLVVKTKNFTNIDSSTKGDSSTFDDYKTHYLSEEWKSQLISSDIKYINQYLDSNLMDKFGYSILS